MGNRVRIRPGLAAAELARLEQARDFVRFQLATIEQTIEWVKRGFTGNTSVVLPPFPGIDLKESVAMEVSEPRTPSIALAVRMFLADHKSHTQEEVVTAMRAELGDHVRVPAIIASLRGKGIVRREDGSYQLTPPAKEPATRKRVQP